MTDKPGLKVIGYARVSTAEQAVSGVSLAAQSASIQAECERRGWLLLDIAVDAGASGRDLRRPGIAEVLGRMARGEAEALVVAKLDRLSRSMLDFASVMATAKDEGWAVVALDCAVDTTSPAGEAMANVLATFAQFERRLIGQRTKDALAVKKASGVRLGRPVDIPPDVAERIRHERSRGRSLRAIARSLENDGVPTPRGGRCWRPSSLTSVLAR